jgi:predicted PurR-regulated permease PerM
VGWAPLSRHAMTPTDTPLDTSEAFRRRARYVVALVALAFVGLNVLWMARQAFLLGFLGVALGVGFYRASRWLAEKTGAPRGLMLGIVLVTVIAGLVLAAVFGGPRLVAEAQALMAGAPEFLAAARERLGLPPDTLAVPEPSNQMTGRVLGVFSTAAGAVASFVVVFVVAAYTAADPRQYTAGALRFVDRRHQPFLRDVLGDMEETLLAWLKGVAIAVAVLGTMAVIGLSILGLPGALALAAFAAVLTIIPTFGPLIGWAPAVVVGFAQGTTTGLWTLGLAVVAQQIEGSIITPKVQGSMVSVGPALIVAGQIVLGALAGFLGVLLVVPVLGVGLVLVRHLYIGPFVEGEPADPDAPVGPQAAPAPLPLIPSS